MRTRSGFAGLLALSILIGLAAGTITLLSSAWPEQAPVDWLGALPAAL
jgi:hypothetical protein